ncbi:MAG: tetratricopeptide repeat protein [Leptospiraceae bacterium]|nr:tetratricopeptide repeat protein [Leptospiraceae bacterium]
MSRADAEKFYNEGVVLANEGKLREALAAFDEAIRLDKDFGFSHNGRGNVLFCLAFYEEALAAYENAIRLNKGDSLPHNGRGNALLYLRCYEEALVAFDEAIRLAKDSAHPHNGRGNALLELRRSEEALAAFDKAICLDKDFTHAYNGRGNALFELSRYEEALKAYEEALRLDRENAHSYNGRGNVLCELNRHDEALSAYAEAIKLDSNFPLPWLNLAILSRNIDAGYNTEQCLYRYYYLEDRSIPGVKFQIFIQFFEYQLYAPLFVYRLFQEYEEYQTFLQYGNLIQTTLQQCADALSLIEYLESDACSLDAIARKKLHALIRFHLGDPFYARQLYDHVLESNADDLCAHYGRIGCLFMYLADNELDSAYEQAMQAMTRLGARESDDRQPVEYYYAGLIMYECAPDSVDNPSARGVYQSALAYFEKAGDYLPALYMRALMLVLSDRKPEAIEIYGAILKEERLLRAGNQHGGYLCGVSVWDIDFDDPEFQLPFYHYAHAIEISEALVVLFEWLEEWADPIDHKLAQEFRNFLKRHPIQLNKETRLNASWRFTEHTKQKLARLKEIDIEQKLEILAVHLSQSFPAWAEFLEQNPDQIARSLGRSIQNKEQEALAYHRMIVYLYARGKLPERTAVLLLFYSLMTQSPREIFKIGRAAFFGLASEIFMEYTLGSVLAQTGLLLPGGLIGIGVFIMFMEFVKKRSDQKSEVIEFRAFKANFLAFIERRRVQLGAAFSEKYPMDNPERWLEQLMD